MSVYTPAPPALGNVGSYQVSSKPFFKGGLVGDGTIRVIEFPTVTNWIHIRNATTLLAGDGPRISFSENGMNTNNFFDLYSTYVENDTNSVTLYLKVAKLYYKRPGSSNVAFDIVAGLTNIPTGSIPNNWSGSAGIG
jgi:hypothetical protein